MEFNVREVYRKKNTNELFFGYEFFEWYLKLYPNKTDCKTFEEFLEKLTGENGIFEKEE